MTKKPKKSGGGAATSGGIGYQHRVGAWIAAHILAEQDASLPWDLPASATFDWLRCETDLPIDDCLAGTSVDGLMYVQAKKTLSLSSDEGSELAKALRQFVHQFLTTRGKPATARPWERAPDPGRDRYVIATTSSSSAPITDDLKKVLDRARGLIASTPLADAATTEKEKAALETVLGHLSTSWEKAASSKPTEPELRQVLSLIRVHVADLQGGEAELRAKDVLRASVLRDPAQTDAAWASLITICDTLATSKGSIDRLGLQAKLLDQGFRLQAARSYREDIKKLQAYSLVTQGDLTRLSRIEVGPVQVKINRPVTAALREQAELSSLLVVGEPGSGKSGALHDLAEKLVAEKRDCVFFAVDRLNAGSLAGVRNELGLEHELVDVLMNWPSSQPKFLVIDALDAARGDKSGLAVRELIRTIVKKDGSWRIVASIRKFDLRYGMEIRDLFRGEPVDGFEDPEFDDIRHLNVPVLSPDELKQVEAQSAELGNLIKSAPVRLNELMRRPFNLRLLADLLGSGVKAAELSPIETEIQLLDRYWARRVIGEDDGGDRRETCLREAVLAMTSTRTLRVNRATLAARADGGDLKHLLTEQVLVEWQQSEDAVPNRYVLAFSHHALFDYAASRLLFRGDPGELAERLSNDRQLAIVIRPSIHQHFQYLWAADAKHQQFWDVVMALYDKANVPEIAKLVGPAVAVEKARVVDDLNPLFSALGSATAATRLNAEKALKHLCGALMVQVGDAGSPTAAASNPELWAAALVRMVGQLRDETAYCIRAVLQVLSEHPDNLTPAQLANVGLVSRNLLEYAWARPVRDDNMVSIALKGVCRTFGTDPSASEALLRRCLEPDHLSKYGPSELFWVTRDIKRIAAISPAFAEVIYTRVFSHEETSDEKTPMGGGQIMAFTSTKKQDYRMSQHALAEKFPGFLENSPLEATRALVAVMDYYVFHEHATSSEPADEQFQFGGRTAITRRDYSGMRDTGNLYDHDEPVKMINAFQAYLKKQVDANNVSQLSQLVDVVVERNKTSLMWRRLLIIAAQHPATFGPLVVPLLFAVPILKSSDTSVLAGQYLRAYAPHLEPGQREAIEKLLLSLPSILPDYPETAVNTRDRLVGCLADAGMVTAEGAELLAKLQAAKEVPANEEYEHGQAYSKAYGEVEYLAGHGVDVDAAPNAHIRQLEKPVREFSEKHLNSTPPQEDIDKVFPAMQALDAALKAATASGVDPEQVHFAAHYLVAAAARVARAEINCAEPVGALVKEVLLSYSTYPEPQYDEALAKQYDEHQSWGSPNARIEAAAGMVVLPRSPSCATEDVLDAVERLSKDPVPAVRDRVVHSLNSVAITAPEFMWAQIERISREEMSTGVLLGFVIGTLENLKGWAPDRITAVAQEILARIKVGPGAEGVRERSMSILVCLYIYRDIAGCRDQVLGAATDPLQNLGEASTISNFLRASVVYGKAGAPDPAGDAVRQRAWKLMETLTESLLKQVGEIAARNEGKTAADWPAEDLETAKSMYRIIDHLGTELYFSSGAYEGGQQATTAEDPEATQARVCRFYQESMKIREMLATAGIASVTHHLMDTLQFLVPCDPAAVFKQIGQVVISGQKGGIQYESMAMDIIVKLVERYLAEYRAVLQGDAECQQALIEVLDIFVGVGWPQAQRLTYRLGEIFQ